MARPELKTVSYFPFYCDQGKKMFYLERKYGNDGFAVFVKLLRELALTENHYLDLSEKDTIMFLSAKCLVEEQKLIDIIEDLVKIGKFNQELREKCSVIWCLDFIDSIHQVYDSRNSKCMSLPDLLVILQGFGRWKPGLSGGKPPGNTQSKVKYSKVKKSNICVFEDFEEFWKAYPMKKGKAEGREAWEKAIQIVSPEVILKAAKAYAEEVKRSGTKYIKRSQGRLNHRRWEDEIAPVDIHEEFETLTPKQFAEKYGHEKWSEMNDKILLGL